MCILPGLVRLDLGLDGDYEEVVGGVSGCGMENYFIKMINTDYLMFLFKKSQRFNLTCPSFLLGQLGTFALVKLPTLCW